MTRNPQSASPACFGLFNAQRALKDGRRSDALTYSRQAVAADPYHIESLLWLAALCGDPHESLRHLTRALVLDPQNEAALEGILWARTRLKESTAATVNAPPPLPRRSPARFPRGMLAVSVALWLLLLVGGSVGSGGLLQAPTESVSVSSVTSSGDAPVVALTSPTAVAAVVSVLTAPPIDTTRVNAERADQTLRELDSMWAQEDWARHIPLMAQAMAFRPDDATLRPNASDAGYLDTRDLLYRAYYQQGLERKSQQDADGALKAFQAAVNLDNDAIEARGELAQVKTALSAPLPQAPGARGEKWIDVNLTTQRFRAYRGQTLVYAWVTSTGEPRRATQPGRYQILDKIPMAYSRFWRLWMPYWMGIYWAGSSENGIHALPILRNGQLLWAGLLGRRVSFGCVILDTKTAKMIYNWAEIGTAVIIHY